MGRVKNQVFNLDNFRCGFDLWVGPAADCMHFNMRNCEIEKTASH
jgi:hypothetical protein